MLYALKTFGKYYFFKTENARAKFVETLPEWEVKHIEYWSTELKKG